MEKRNGRRIITAIAAAVTATVGVTAAGLVYAQSDSVQQSGEVGRYQLVSGRYEMMIKPTGRDERPNSGPVDGLFKLDTKTGRVWVYAEVLSKGQDGKIITEGRWRELR